MLLNAPKMEPSMTACQQTTEGVRIRYLKQINLQKQLTLSVELGTAKSSFADAVREPAISIILKPQYISNSGLPNRQYALIDMRPLEQQQQQRKKIEECVASIHSEIMHLTLN